MVKNNKCRLIIGTAMTISAFLGLSILAKIKMKSVEIDGKNPYLDGCGEKGQEKDTSIYEKYIKRATDKILSFVGLIVLVPVYMVISLAIYIDDPGPVIFIQKRIGKNKHFIKIHKFRSMKMSAPHDIPTHQLSNPEQYITRVGRFLRKYSLDELPQIWDIFCGKMSVIGPRPALWNQSDLVAEREKYGANDITPGLTGWAQINGRDELEIVDKARLDGEYCANLKSGGLQALLFDIRCLFGTVKAVISKKGVVEGGTGEIHRNDSDGGKSAVAYAAEAGFENYGYKKTFHIDKTICKKVMIAGAGSYIGEAFKTYASRHYPRLVVDVMDTTDNRWCKKSLRGYDAVFHVAGIAHADIGKVSKRERDKYYSINTDLAIEMCQKAKMDGVKQFILMSSMIVYGEAFPYGKIKFINEFTVPAPDNFYGDSKWQADKGVRALEEADFAVAVIRSPMIYGRGSKGNYPSLARLAKKVPIFPDIKNQRSMLYIDNLCEFLCLLVLSGESGVYFPQNGEYSSTSSLIREIGVTSGKTVYTTKLLNPAVRIASYIPGKIGKLANKAFGSTVYSQSLSIYHGLEYQIYDARESIIQTEGRKI